MGRWVVLVFGTDHGAPLPRTGVVSRLRRSAGGEETEFDLIDGEGATTHYDLATSGITSIRFRAGPADAPRSTSLDARK
ncbi:hypothetical protein D1871_20285 [Nakamurella silvestris]|nr:hypothetical protein D1871_20285 [Nakamurella silvestris]